MVGTVLNIARYPVKGFNGEALDAVTLAPGAGLPGDRRFAVLRPGAKLEAEGHTPKTAFLTLSRDPKIATLDVRWEPESEHLQILRGGRPVARGQPGNPVGRALLDQFFAAWLGSVAGTPKIVAREGDDGAAGFWDVAEPLVSILNAASLAELARVAGAPAEAARFRGNILVDGDAPWMEDDLVGARFTIGGVTLEGVESITRCAATNVGPAGAADAGERSRNFPRLLQQAFDRDSCGLYARVVDGGDLCAKDTLSV